MKKKKKDRIASEINTTALPDIIFMLLFFFMVSTVMRQNTSDQNIKLPILTSFTTLEKSKSNVLHIVLANNDEGVKSISINNHISEINNVSELLSKEILIMKKKHFYPKKAILRIAKTTPMSSVNLVKNALQKANVLNVEYVHLARR